MRKNDSMTISTFCLPRVSEVYISPFFSVCAKNVQNPLWTLLYLYYNCPVVVVNATGSNSRIITIALMVPSTIPEIKLYNIYLKGVWFP